MQVGSSYINEIVILALCLYPKLQNLRYLNLLWLIILVHMGFISSLCIICWSHRIVGKVALKRKHHWTYADETLQGEVSS